MRIIDRNERCIAFSAFRKDLDLRVYHHRLLPRYIRSESKRISCEISRKQFKGINDILSSHCTDNISLFTFPCSYNSIAVNFKHLIQRYVE